MGLLWPKCSCTIGQEAHQPNPNLTFTDLYYLDTIYIRVGRFGWVKKSYSKNEEVKNVKYENFSVTTALFEVKKVIKTYLFTNFGKVFRFLRIYTSFFVIF